MTTRARAIEWLEKHGVEGGHIVASKRYAPEESWTKEKAWWIQVPARAVRDEQVIHIACEFEPGADEFHHIEVPAAFFQEHLDDFATIGDDKINLFLAAEPGIEFQDQRGPGKVSFAPFVKDHGAQ